MVTRKSESEPLKGNEHAPPREFRQSGHALGQEEGRDVVLFEVGEAAVDDQGDARDHVVNELPLQVIVGFLGHA